MNRDRGFLVIGRGQVCVGPFNNKAEADAMLKRIGMDYSANCVWVRWPTKTDRPHDATRPAANQHFTPAEYEAAQ